MEKQISVSVTKHDAYKWDQKITSEMIKQSYISETPSVMLSDQATTCPLSIAVNAEHHKAENEF